MLPGMDNSPFALVESSDVRTLSLETRIARQAYRLWESYGRPEEDEPGIWMEAERQVLSMEESVNQQAFGVDWATWLRKAPAAQSPGADEPEHGLFSTA